MRPALIPLALLLALALAFPALGSAQAPRTLVPLGGGNTLPPLADFSRVVIEQASAPIVDLYVVPSTYGDDPADRAANIALAQTRTSQLESQCNAVVVEYVDFTGCTATLLILFDRNDAETPANSAPLENPDADGVWILGGDQTIAMRVLANTPAEQVMEDAYNRGVVFGGTSAGAAVESRSMIAGYTWDGWPYNALERPMVEIWWSNDGDDERGLIFSSENVIWDQHFYERGRYTRLLNIIAQSDEQFDGQSKLGVGLDWGTGVVLQEDSLLSRVFGETSIAIVDFETAGATHTWVGPLQTLSARNVLNHIMPPGDAYSYDVTTRTPSYQGASLEYVAQPGWSGTLLSHPEGQGALILGGDLLWDPSAPVWDEFLSRVAPQFPPRNPIQREIVIVSAGYGTAAQNQTAGERYEAELRAMGWQEGVRIIALDATSQDASWNRNRQTLRAAAGVIFIGGNQTAMTPVINTDEYRTYMQTALESAPVVLTDRAVTSVMGDWYANEPEPTSTSNRQLVASESFWEGEVDIQPGMGIVPGASFQSLMTYNQHWGRAYQLLHAHPDSIVFGISEMTAIVIEGNGAYVAGERSVIAFDGRAGTYTIGDNTAIGAFNIVMDIFAPGDAVAPSR